MPGRQDEVRKLLAQSKKALFIHLRIALASRRRQNSLWRNFGARRRLAPQRWTMTPISFQANIMEAREVIHVRQDGARYSLKRGSQLFYLIEILPCGSKWFRRWGPPFGKWLHCWRWERTASTIVQCSKRLASPESIASSRCQVFPRASWYKLRGRRKEIKIVRAGILFSVCRLSVSYYLAADSFI